MSTQSIAVENMVVAALKDLFAHESAVESTLKRMRLSRCGAAKPEALFERVMDLDSRARRIERFLDAMGDPAEVL